MYFLNFYHSVIWTNSLHVSFSTVRLFPIHYSVIFFNVIKPKSQCVAQDGLELIIFLVHSGITITNVYHKPDLLVYDFMYIIPQQEPTNIPKHSATSLRVSANITSVEINIYHSRKMAIICKLIVQLKQYIKMSVSSNLHTSFKVCAASVFRSPSSSLTWFLQQRSPIMLHNNAKMMPSIYNGRD